MGGSGLGAKLEVLGGRYFDTFPCKEQCLLEALTGILCLVCPSQLNQASAASPGGIGGAGSNPVSLVGGVKFLVLSRGPVDTH